MEFKKISKKEEGRFINRYDLTYETEDGKTKVYEIISRDKNLKTFSELHSKRPDAVVIIATDEFGEKILVNKEFRLAVGEWVYNFPAGLIDPGETPIESARRELKEETGLEITEIVDLIGPSYSAVGFSNEVNVVVVCKAGGKFHKSTSSVEEIVPGWYTKEEMRKLLEMYPFAARTQSYCYLWSRE